jgi:integrase
MSGTNPVPLIWFAMPTHYGGLHMPRPKKWPPTVLFHKPTGQERIRVNGQDIWLGPAGSPEAKKKYTAVLAYMEAHAGQLPAEYRAGVLTCGGIAAQFWVHAEGYYSTEGRELENFRWALRPFRRLFDDLSAEELGPAHLETLQRAMASGSWMTAEEKAEYKKRGKPSGWCRNVVNRRIVRIQTMWKWAERQGLVPKGHYHHLLTVEPLGKQVQWVRSTPKKKGSSWEDVEKVLAALEAVKRKEYQQDRGSRYKNPVAAMLALQWWSGMRSCEVRLMRTADVNVSGEVWIYTPKDKNRWRDEADEAPREVLLGPESQALLYDWLDPKHPDRFIFVSRIGKAYRNDTYAQAVARACRRAGVKVTPYQGRHAMKKRAAKDFGLHGARQVLGQKSLGSTAQYDSEVDRREAEAIARRIG